MFSLPTQRIVPRLDPAGIVLAVDSLCGRVWFRWGLFVAVLILTWLWDQPVAHACR
jgi:hypothetical protein